MKTIKIELGDETRNLRYDMNALSAIEEKTGHPIDQLADALGGIRTIRTLLWAGLLHESPDLDEWDVGRWVDGENFTYVSEKITEAMQQVFGAGDANPPIAVGGTGLE